ncbi:MAG: hypothetical protein QOJ68_2738 [Blastococcus sp.]|jgi:hypothetical protein|nr:hypothetical protein [Blastococcus sp.]
MSPRAEDRKQTPAPGGGPRRARRRAAILGALALVAVAAVLAVIIGANGSGGSSAVAAGATGSTPPTPSAPPTNTGGLLTPATPSPTGPSSAATDLPKALPEVPLTSPAPVGDGVVISLARIESIQGAGTGPGNIDGPAIRVTVRVLNGTSRAISLGGVAVNMYYGANRMPASPLDDPSRRSFDGQLTAGRSADGVYVFTVPAGARNHVTVEVGYQAGAPRVLFTGAVR